MQVANAFFNELERALYTRRSAPVFRIAVDCISMGWDNNHVKIHADTAGLTIVKSQAWVDEKDGAIDVAERFLFVDPRTTTENVVNSMIDILHFYKGPCRQ